MDWFTPIRADLREDRGWLTPRTLEEAASRITYVHVKMYKNQTIKIYGHQVVKKTNKRVGMLLRVMKNVGHPQSQKILLREVVHLLEWGITIGRSSQNGIIQGLNVEKALRIGSEYKMRSYYFLNSAHPHIGRRTKVPTPNGERAIRRRKNRGQTLRAWQQEWWKAAHNPMDEGIDLEDYATTKFNYRSTDYWMKQA